MSSFPRLRSLAAVAIATLAAGWPAAHAQSTTVGNSATGWYGSLDGAFTHVSDITGTSSGANFTTHFKDGWEAGGTIGYTFLNTNPSDLADNNLALALEAEGGYIRNDVDTVSVLGGSASAHGYLEQVPITGSIVLRYHIFSPLTVFAGIGGGMGYEHLNINSVGGTGFSTSDSDWEAAYQAKAGVDLSFGGGLGLDAGVKYYHLFRTNMGTSINTRMLYAGLTWSF
ncbi:MAG TPA: outer membrane beta-barrel protein [Candidatus Cybelea sp.]|nr:outer membrane beta-barrel protein [Candidatus Cybelea sp.]